MGQEEWTEQLKRFHWMLGKVRLGFADFLKFGRQRFGTQFVDEALEQLEFDLPLVNEATDIASIPEDIRRPNLTAAHYVIIARCGLSGTAKAKWARMASELNMSPVQLKLSIAKGSVVEVSTARHQSHGFISIHGIRAEFDIWARKMGGVDGIIKLAPETISEILNELNAMGDLYNDLMIHYGEQNISK